MAQCLGLADGFTAGGTGLGDLPQERPKDKAQVPTTITGMISFILLGQ
ncbi:MAG TPA: hypothetical protein VFD66_06625 [Verrucomicrobiae bacterium]|nr:hypothetical protein [Verrucomicrobiae bacterium]